MIKQMICKKLKCKFTSLIYRVVSIAIYNFLLVSSKMSSIYSKGWGFRKIVFRDFANSRLISESLMPPSN